MTLTISGIDTARGRRRHGSRVVALTQMGRLHLTAGRRQGGSLVSPKIPFAYDYGDGDTNVPSHGRRRRPCARTLRTLRARVAALAGRQWGTVLRSRNPGAADRREGKVHIAIRQTRVISTCWRKAGTRDGPASRRRLRVFSKTEGMSDAAASLYSQVYETPAQVGTSAHARRGRLSGPRARDDSGQRRLVSWPLPRPRGRPGINEQGDHGLPTFASPDGYRPRDPHGQVATDQVDSLLEGMHVLACRR